MYIAGKSSSVRAKGHGYTAGRNKRTQSARFKKGPPDGRLKRNKSLLLDPDKLGTLTKRHARYSSMSPRFAVWSFNTNQAYKPKLSDLNVNDAIHSFGAVDTDDEDEDDGEESNSQHHQKFFAQKHNHEHTRSSLTVDMKRSSFRNISTKRVPTFKVDINPLMVSNSADVNDDKAQSIKSEPNLHKNHSTPPMNEIIVGGNFGKISPFATQQGSTPTPDRLQEQDSISDMSKAGGYTPQDTAPNTPLRTAMENKEDDFLDEEFFIPPPNYTKRESLKTIDAIKAEKAMKRAKRLSAKRNSQSLLKGLKKKDKTRKSGKNKGKEIEFTDLELTPIDQYMKDRKDAKKKGTHRRGYSSDAIQALDFNDMDNGTSIKSKPGRVKNKMSIHDSEHFGKVWKGRNTMAPRPSATQILSQSKHDEFISLFQQQLAEVKKDKLLSRKQSHQRNLEKRNSVPDFAMLSEIDSEADINAHRQRLSTLREDQISGLTLSKSVTMQSVNEINNKLEVSTTNDNNNNSKTMNGFRNGMNGINGSKQKLLDDDGQSKSSEPNEKILMERWDKNMSPQHGCCYYFCCCCICGIFRKEDVQSDSDEVMTYSPHPN